VVVRRSARGTNNPIVALTKSITPIENQECDKCKKKLDDENASINDNLDDGETSGNNNTKVGVSEAVDNKKDTTEDTDNDGPIPKELESDLGPYWTLAQSSKAYVLSTIASYSNIEASKCTPQYGFNQGLKEFETVGYEATVKELDEYLLGMGAVQMLKPSEINKTIRFDALNYLMFLKRKRCGKVKARGCAGGRPQREYISKDESSSPTVSI
jgi:hypothetical protein